MPGCDETPPTCDSGPHSEHERLSRHQSWRSRRPRAFCASVLVLALTGASAQASELIVFAAASLKPAFDAIIVTPQVKAVGDILVSYAASSQLARQIEHGAPAALFISADQDWMDVVEASGKIVPGTRSNLLGNALVLIAPADSAVRLSIGPQLDLATALGDNGRLAIGEPNSVPAGKYARAALRSLGLWAQVESRLVPAVHVRAALNFVSRHEAPLGIVYRTDALSEPAVRVVGTFPASSHAPIVYPVALLRGADSASSRKLLALLRGADAAAVFRRFGFEPQSP